MMLTIDYKYAVGEVYTFLSYLITKAKAWCFALAFLFVFMPIVNAETLTYNVCKSGCEYDDLNSVIESINNLEKGNDIIINFLNNENYDFNRGWEFYEQSKIIINGKNNNLSMDYLSFYAFKDVEINNINFNLNQGFSFRGTLNEGDSRNQTNQEKARATLSNVNFSYSPQILMTDGIYNFNNTILNGILLASNTDMVFSNSKVGTILAGITMGPGDSTNIYIRANSSFNNPIKRVTNTMSSLESTGFGFLLNENINSLFELDLSDIREFYESMGVTITDEIAAIIDGMKNNNIFIYQETNKIIKENTNISEFEKEFVDTYKDSEGYDDIKDLPVNWKSEDESIAKVENRIIKVIKPGKVDLVGTKGNDIDTIHLTVEPSSSGTVEKKEPETKNYAQADFSSNDLNSVIPLTNEEQVLKDSGKNVEVFLEVKDVSKTVAPEEKNLIEEKLSSNEEIGTYIDVSLFKQVEGEEASKIEKTNGNIKVSLNVPDSLINKDNKIKRTYYILRLHDGVVDKLETNFDGKVLTFETDRFSTYALTYKDEVINGVNNPKTGDNIIKYMGILFGSIMLIVFMLIEKINIKNKN